MKILQKNGIFLFFIFIFLFFRKLVIKNRAFGNNTIFLQQFFRFRGGGFPLPPWLRPWAEAIGDIHQICFSSFEKIIIEFSTKHCTIFPSSCSVPRWGLAFLTAGNIYIFSTLLESVESYSGIKFPHRPNNEPFFHLRSYQR